MNLLRKLLLKRLCKKLVKQGMNHKKNITAYYEIMAKAAQVEFVEESRTTLKAFLSDCAHDAFEKIYKKK